MAVLKDLIVHGASRFLNGTYFNTINAESIGASEGVFNKIVATTGKIDSLSTEDLTANNATVLSLLDVRGELHTNQWTNSNIATIDGSFYITPTIGIPEGTMTTTANSVTVNGSNFPISSLYVNGINSDNTASTVAWTSGSKVLVTGEILVNGVYMPLGTLIGILDGDASATQIKIKSITDNRYKTASSLAEIGTQSTALPCRNVKVSLYQTSRSSTLYPLGIFMTALGENGKTFLDIYGGGYATSTAVAGGFAKPVLRIGNLAGLPSIGNSTPTGYGIYTSNGYFSGTIVATLGKIGSYEIGSQYLQAADGTTGIAIKDDSSTANWAFWAGGASTSAAKFRVTQDGTLYCKDIQATGGSISGDVSIGGNVTIASTVKIGGKDQSEYLNSNIKVGGRNLLLGTSSSTTWTVSLNSSNYAVKDCYKTYSPVPSIFVVDDLVTISFDWSTTATGGNFHLECGTVTPYVWGTVVDAIGTRNATSNYVDISSSNKSGHCEITFKITSAVASAADTLQWMRIRVDGTDTSGKTFTINNAKAERGNKATDWTPAPEDIDVNKYITTISGTSGISVHNVNDENNFVNINSSGMSVYKGGKANANKVAFFGSDVQIGASNTGYVKISSSGMDIYRGTVELAHIGYGKSNNGGNESDSSYYSFGTRSTTTSEFNQNAGYAMGSLCVHDGKIYVAKTALNAGSWNSSNWQLAIGGSSVVEGFYNIASGYCSHAEGNMTKALTDCSHAEGLNTIAKGARSHAEGEQTYATGASSHSEGTITEASGEEAHAEGYGSKAIGNESHAQNEETIAQGKSQTAIGKYNAASGTYNSYVNTDYAFIIGNGTSDSARSNALTVNWKGDVVASGDIIGAVSKTTITSFSSGWTTYDTDSTVTLRKRGGVVTLSGGLKNTSAVTLNTSLTTVFTIPTGYRPSQRMNFLSQGSGTNVFLMTIETSGVVEFSRYRDTGSGTANQYPSVTANSWFPFQITWIMD